MDRRDPSWYDDGKDRTDEGYLKCPFSACGLQDVRPGKVQCCYGDNCLKEIRLAHNYTKWLLQETLRALAPFVGQLEGDDCNLVPVYLDDPEQSPVEESELIS